ncbi:MAG: hypothetical protein LN408_04245 [Candidatus Thermoplasmatota archaeon]|nr:hypothetical protein [Candidatus Thermoplasmatota archaeon]
MVKNDMWGKIGSWAFLIGIIIALIVGLYAAYNLETNGETFGGIIAWVLAVLGAIVGLVSAYGMGTITEKEVPSFLLAGIALVVMYGVFKGIELDPWIGSLLHGVSMSLSILIAPAVGILAIKAIWDIGKEV